MAAKYSYLETNGRGTTINPIDRNAQNTFAIAGQTVQNYNRAWELFAGVNYYIIGYDMKISAGYEFDQFYQRETVAAGAPFNGSIANVQGVRVQMQLLF